MERFLQTLYKQNFSPSGEDKLLLKDVREEGYSVKLMYQGLDPSPAIEFPYRLVWNPVVPPKTGFFAWEATWGKVLMLDQLKHHGRAFANKCFLCEEDEETIDHLLINCKSAKTLWNLLLSVVGTSWVFPRSVLHTLLAWQGAAVVKSAKKYGWQHLCVYSGPYGAKEIGWCSRMRSPLFIGLKLTL